MIFDRKNRRRKRRQKKYSKQNSVAKEGATDGVSLGCSSQPMKTAGRRRWAVSANSKSKAKNSQSAGMTYQLLLMSKGRCRRGVSDIKLDKNVLSPLKESKLNM
jgi:hypothetical protein